MPSPQDEQVRVYEQLCQSYRAIDDFRAKLLGFLPLATGTGVFFLVTDQAKIEFVQSLFRPIGIFGFVITLGLSFYELYGIKKCTAIIKAGKALEAQLKVQYGQFTQRPSGVGLLINEPLAAGIIYPAVLAAWMFLALAFPPSHPATLSQVQDSGTLIVGNAAPYWAIRVFVLGFSASLLYNLLLIKDDLKTAMDHSKAWMQSFMKPDEGYKQ